MSAGRRITLAALLISASAVGLNAQQSAEQGAQPKFDKAPEGVVYDDSRPEYVEEVIEVERPDSRSEPRPFALLRGLDKLSGRVTDIHAPVGAPVVYDRLTITVGDCRAPPADQADDAYVFLTVDDPKHADGHVFAGWMFASSPALSAMDHQRYDVWVLSCAIS